MGDINFCKPLQAAANWKDATHLNATGAKLFSVLLNEQIAKTNK